MDFNIALHIVLVSHEAREPQDNLIGKGPALVAIMAMNFISPPGTKARRFAAEVELCQETPLPRLAHFRWVPLAAFFHSRRERAWVERLDGGNGCRGFNHTVKDILRGRACSLRSTSRLLSRPNLFAQTSSATGSISTPVEMPRKRSAR